MSVPQMVSPGKANKNFLLALIKAQLTHRDMKQPYWRRSAGHKREGTYGPKMIGGEAKGSNPLLSE